MHLISVILSLVALTNARDVRITGGRDTDISEHPYQVSIEERDIGHICGGALISSKLVLTAASCMGKLPHFYTVRVGTSFREYSGYRTDILAIEFAWEYGFGENVNDYDVCIIKIYYEFPLGPLIQIINLTEKGCTYPDGLEANFTGWGKQEEGHTAPHRLQVVDMQLVSRGVCNDSYSTIEKTVTDQMMCFAGEEKGFCQGDAGSPLVHENKLIGIASWSVGCARAGFPGVFVDISNDRVYDSIQRLIKKNSQ